MVHLTGRCTAGSNQLRTPNGKGIDERHEQQPRSAGLGIALVTAIVVIAAAGQCDKTPVPDTTPSPAPVISIE